MNIILASGSPRRQQFLRDLGLNFQVVVADIDETPLPSESPEVLVERLASSKARAVAKKIVQQKKAADTQERNPLLIIAADTVVALDGEILGKPTDSEDAALMLARLRSRPHQVWSGLTVLSCDEEMNIDRQLNRINRTDVYMRGYSDEEIERYVASGDPLDKAGAYAIQHPTFAPGERLDGCISGVMGLSLDDLVTLLGKMGLPVQCDLHPICEQYAKFSCCQRNRRRD
ncbi:MAG: Maf family protein [Chloroflexota bacterium]